MSAFAWDQLVLATRNQGKIREFAEMFAPFGISVKSVYDFSGVPEVVEDGHTFAENAIKKAVSISKILKLPALADDSGLEVDALGGQPGVYSARFAGSPGDDGANNRKLLQLMEGIPWEQRTARFCCVLAMSVPGREILLAEGTCAGQIALQPKGDGGFGYDPLFYLPQLEKTMAELSRTEKNKISHRGNALRELRSKWLLEWEKEEKHQ